MIYIWNEQIYCFSVIILMYFFKTYVVRVLQYEQMV